MSPRTTRKTADIDVMIGHRVRIARMRVGMSQEDLAEAIGLTFQQVQKYEKATNRISAGRIVAIAAALGVPGSELLPELSELNVTKRGVTPADRLAMATSGHELAARLVQLNPAQRKLVLDLLMQMEVTRNGMDLSRSVSADTKVSQEIIPGLAQGLA